MCFRHIDCLCGIMAWSKVKPACQIGFPHDRSGSCVGSVFWPSVQLRIRPREDQRLSLTSHQIVRLSRVWISDWHLCRDRLMSDEVYWEIWLRNCLMEYFAWPQWGWQLVSCKCLMKRLRLPLVIGSLKVMSLRVSLGLIMIFSEDYTDQTHETCMHHIFFFNMVEATGRLSH